MESTALVYVLVHKKKPIFKIGSSASFNNRLDSLERCRFDLEKSRAFTAPTRDLAIRTERYLHTMFGEHRINAGDSLIGDTEFFAIEKLDEALRVAGQLSQIHGGKVVEIEAEALEKPKLDRRHDRELIALRFLKMRQRTAQRKATLAFIEDIKNTIQPIASILGHEETAKFIDQELRIVAKAEALQTVLDVANRAPQRYSWKIKASDEYVAASVDLCYGFPVLKSTDCNKYVRIMNLPDMREYETTLTDFRIHNTPTIPRM